MSEKTMTSPASSVQSSAQFQGKVCVVTGASSGLGEAIAVMMAGRGAAVTLCGRDTVRLQASLTLCIRASGGHAERFLTVDGDVLDAKARKNIIDLTVSTFGGVDVLVANAGMNHPLSGIGTTTEESYDMLMDVNVKSVFFLIQEALPALVKSGGNIVAVSSLSSLVASSPNIVYPMSKAAIDHMVRCLAVDLGGRHIRVNAVNPGFVPTRIRRDYAEGEEEVNRHVRKVQETEVNKQPLGDTPMTAEGVAESVCFLASDSAHFITGQCLPIDAGRGFMGAFDSSNK